MQTALLLVALILSIIELVRTKAYSLVAWATFCLALAFLLRFFNIS